MQDQCWNFILVDAHSKWMEVKMVKSATSLTTIEELRQIFATHGLPEMLVTDNATIFTSEEFKEFTKRNGIHRLLTILPQMNELCKLLRSF